MVRAPPAVQDRGETFRNVAGEEKYRCKIPKANGHPYDTEIANTKDSISSHRKIHDPNSAYNREAVKFPQPVLCQKTTADGGVRRPTPLTIMKKRQPCNTEMADTKPSKSSRQRVHSPIFSHPRDVPTSHSRDAAKFATPIAWQEAVAGGGFCDFYYLDDNGVEKMGMEEVEMLLKDRHSCLTVVPTTELSLGISAPSLQLGLYPTWLFASSSTDLKVHESPVPPLSLPISPAIGGLSGYVAEDELHSSFQGFRDFGKITYVMAGSSGAAHNAPSPDTHADYPQTMTSQTTSRVPNNMLAPVSSILLSPKGQSGKPEKGGKEYDGHYTNDCTIWAKKEKSEAVRRATRPARQQITYEMAQAAGDSSFGPLLALRLRPAPLNVTKRQSYKVTGAGDIISSAPAPTPPKHGPLEASMQEQDLYFRPLLALRSHGHWGSSKKLYDKSQSLPGEDENSGGEDSNEEEAGGHDHSPIAKPPPLNNKGLSVPTHITKQHNPNSDFAKRRQMARRYSALQRVQGGHENSEEEDSKEEDGGEGDGSGHDHAPGQVTAPTTTGPARLQEPPEDLAKDFLSPLNLLEYFLSPNPGLVGAATSAESTWHITPTIRPFPRRWGVVGVEKFENISYHHKDSRSLQGEAAGDEEYLDGSEFEIMDMDKDKEEFSSFMAAADHMTDSLAEITERNNSVHTDVAVEEVRLIRECSYLLAMMMDQFYPDPVNLVEAVEAIGLDAGKWDELVLDPSTGQRLKPHQAVDALILRRRELSGQTDSDEPGSDDEAEMLLKERGHTEYDPSCVFRAQRHARHGFDLPVGVSRLYRDAMKLATLRPGENPALDTPSNAGDQTVDQKGAYAGVRSQYAAGRVSYESTFGNHEQGQSFDRSRVQD
ncbi:hypothetical protein DL770_006791 [Monosporascus sp. CRB-9-2]|nr:hypothetical protein DL770_006791 [Monosporascus sp. CRB-9-2]